MDEKGQGTLEYAILLALVAIVAIAVLSYLGFQLRNIFYSLAEVLLNNCESVPECVRDYGGSFPSWAQTGTGKFRWPTKGRITQRTWHCHHAVDIANSEGTKIYAADTGYVVVAGWLGGGYGKTVVINHGNGFQTLYAHLSVIRVQANRNVNRGDLIGRMGNTGHSTGSHLHFEIREGSQLHDPLEFVSPP
jgi:murein DD-endopeptidase MepM/ murein hydrolase activator NlpD/Flp pilus assembly pilin Flp